MDNGKCMQNAQTMRNAYQLLVRKLKQNRGFWRPSQR